ncbi:MAG TPA: NUDIX domain-containing protein [Bacillota bacterium]
MRKVPDRLIACRSLHGGIKHFPAGEVRFRPAAYGLALEDGRVLLVRSVFTGQLELPGGAVEPWETIPEGLCREFREETGVEPEPLRFLRFTENYFSMFGRAFHSLRFYYLVRVAPAATFEPQIREVSEVGWYSIEQLASLDVAPDDRVVLDQVLSEG